MANTRFFLDTRNAKEGKPCVLKIAIAHKMKTAYISLDAKLVPSTQWDAEKNSVFIKDVSFLLLMPPSLYIYSCKVGSCK